MPKVLAQYIVRFLPILLHFMRLDSKLFFFSIIGSSATLYCSGESLRSNPTDGSDLIVSPRARMPEKLSRFGFSRFLGFPLQLEAFRPNPGTIRLPPPLASASASSTD